MKRGVVLLKAGVVTSNGNSYTAASLRKMLAPKIRAVQGELFPESPYVHPGVYTKEIDLSHILPPVPNAEAFVGKSVLGPKEKKP